MEILTLKSKVSLGCNLCDKCCIYRGDIRIIPVNACIISKFLRISLKEFLEKYTEKLENNKLELVLKTTGNLKQCILYDNEKRICKIHSVKPMQCVMFPLVPENIKRDYFYNSEQCKFVPEIQITVDEWINGNNKIYKKYKQIYIEWIKFLEWAQPEVEKYSKEQIEELYKILFEDYNIKSINLIYEMKKRMWKVEKIIKKNKKKE